MENEEEPRIDEYVDIWMDSLDDGDKILVQTVDDDFYWLPGIGRVDAGVKKIEIFSQSF